MAGCVSTNVRRIRIPSGVVRCPAGADAFRGCSRPGARPRGRRLRRPVRDREVHAVGAVGPSCAVRDRGLGAGDDAAGRRVGRRAWAALDGPDAAGGAGIEGRTLPQSLGGNDGAASIRASAMGLATTSEGCHGLEQDRSHEGSASGNRFEAIGPTRKGLVGRRGVRHRRRRAVPVRSTCAKGHALRYP